MNIYLVRHADYVKDYGLLKGRLPVELSKIGLEQAKVLNNFFKDKSIEKIYSSAVKRCKQTAEIISNQKIEIEFKKDLLEALIPYQGYKEGNWEDEAYTHEELGGESILDIYQRVVSFYNEVIKQKHENVIICSHGDPLHFLYVHLKNGKIENNYKELRNLYSDYQSKASVRLVKVEGGEIKKVEMLLEQEVLND